MAYRKCRLPLRASALADCQLDWDPRKFQSRSYPLPEVICLVERRISLFWIVPGQTKMSMSLPSLPGPVSGSRRLLTIGSVEWLPTIIVLLSTVLASLLTD